VIFLSKKKFNPSRKIFGIKAWQIFIVLILALFVVSGGSPLGKLQAQFGIGRYVGEIAGNTLDASKIYATPAWERLECGADGVVKSQTPATNSWSCSWVSRCQWIKAECTENVKPDAGCQINVLVGSEGQNIGNTIYYKVIPKTSSDLDPSKDALSAGYNTVSAQKGAEQLITTIYNDQKVFIWADPGFDLVKKINPYKLFYYYGGAKQYWNSQSCSVSGVTSQLQWKISNLCKSDTEGKCKQTNNDVIQFDSWVNFFTNWYLSPIDGSPTLNGQQVACSGGAIYKIGEATLWQGNNVRYLTTDVLGYYGIGQTKECCPGMHAPNKVCDSNWNWVSDTTPQQCQSTAQCQLGSQIPGGWSVDYSDPNQKTQCRGICTANKCDYRVDCRTVSCNFDTQCNNGQICDASSGTCKNSVCVGADCEGDGGGNQTDWIFIILTIAIIILILIIIYVVI